MGPPEALVAVDGNGGSAAEANDPTMAAFAGDVSHALPEIDVVDPQPDELATADPRVEEEQEDGRIAAIRQV